MTATDELRRMLDERGVEWKAFKPNPWVDTTSWDINLSDPRRELEAGYYEYEDGVTLMRFWNATPEQAINATLGSGTCVNMDGETDAEWFTCSECNTELRVHEPFDAFSIHYCPNCGKRVVE